MEELEIKDKINNGIRKYKLMMYPSAVNIFESLEGYCTDDMEALRKYYLCLSKNYILTDNEEKKENELECLKAAKELNNFNLFDHVLLLKPIFFKSGNEDMKLYTLANTYLGKFETDKEIINLYTGAKYLVDALYCTFNEKLKLFLSYQLMIIYYIGSIHIKKDWFKASVFYEMYLELSNGNNGNKLIKAKNHNKMINDLDEYANSYKYERPRFNAEEYSKNYYNYKTMSIIDKKKYLSSIFGKNFDYDSFENGKSFSECYIYKGCDEGPDFLKEDNFDSKLRLERKYKMVSGNSINYGYAQYGENNSNSDLMEMTRIANDDWIYGDN